MKKLGLYYFFAYYGIFLTILLLCFDSLSKPIAIVSALVFSLLMAFTQGLIIKTRSKRDF